MTKLDKGYYPTHQDHVYNIDKVIKGDRKYVFKVKDSSGRILNQIFYPEQLQKITENLYRIEKVLQKRKRRGIIEIFVKWLNYPSTYNSWISEKELVKLKTI